MDVIAAAAAVVEWLHHRIVAAAYETNKNQMRHSQSLEMCQSWYLLGYSPAPLWNCLVVAIGWEMVIPLSKQANTTHHGHATSQFMREINNLSFKKSACVSRNNIRSHEGQESRDAESQ